MKFRAFLLSACFAGFCAQAAGAYDVVVRDDPGGEVAARIAQLRQLRANGERIVIDGSCLSACTLFLELPRRQICATPRAVFGFHAALVADKEHNLHPTRAGTTLIMRQYPPAIQAWIRRHGGLTRNFIYLRGNELHRFVDPC